MQDFRYQPVDERNVQFVLEMILVGGGLGFLFGVAYIPFCFWFEAVVLPRLGPPQITSGQMVFVAWVSLIGLGFGIGMAFAVARRFNWLIAAVLAVMVAHLIGGTTLSAWNGSIQQHGRCPTEWLVYAPPLALSGLTFLVATATAVIGFMRMTGQRSSRRLDGHGAACR